MPNISVFDGLDPKEIEVIEQEITNRNFKNYTDLSEWCKSHGWQIERGALWNRGSKLKKKLQNLKNATEMAKIYVSASEDDAGALSEATLALVQSGLFDVLSNLDDANEETNTSERVELLGKAARAAADVGRASISVKKYKKEVQARAELVANKIAETAKKGGLSADLVNSIKRDILGVAA